MLRGTLKSLVRSAHYLELPEAPTILFCCKQTTFSTQASQTINDEKRYVAPFGPAVSRVKKLSLFSCACALAAGPVIFGLDTHNTLTAKASIAGTLATFGIFTTGLLQWFTGPYIQQLTYRKRSSDQIEVTTLNVFASPQTHRFTASEVHPADTIHPLATFMVHDKVFYVDPDHFPDKQLLAILAPHKAAGFANSEATEQRKERTDEGAKQK